MDANGLLQWDASGGQWLIYRIGRARTMANSHPLPDDIIGKSPEADKMSAEQNRFHWQTVIDPLKAKVGDFLGDSFKHLLKEINSFFIRIDWIMCNCYLFYSKNTAYPSPMFPK